MIKFERCSGCGVSTRGCVCDIVKPLRANLGVLILRHPAEANAELGTAELITKLLPQVVLKTGLSWRNLAHALGREANPKEWVVLYLGSRKLLPAIAACNQTLVYVDKKGQPLNEKPNIKGVILIDGNWSQSKALWWRNSWLTKCRRAVLNPKARSLYSNLRREPRKESVSTLEALAETVAVLSNNPQLREQLVEPLGRFLDKMRKPGGGAASDASHSASP